MKHYAKFASRLSSSAILFGGVIVVSVALASYYFGHWHSLNDFITSIDNCKRLFWDFFRHYYPMGQNILQSKWPVPGYYYSAYFALILFPFGLLTKQNAFLAWGAVQFLCLLLFWIFPIRRLLKFSWKTAFSYAGLIAISLPVFHNIVWGQVSLLMIVIILIAFDAHLAKRPILAGILLAFGAAIKYFPAIFIFYFLIKRDLRVLIAFFVSAIIFFVLLPASILGLSEWVAYQNAIRNNIADALWIAKDINSQYLVHVGLRYADLLFPSSDQTGLAITLRILGLAVAALDVAVVWKLHLQKIDGEATLSLVALFVTLPFILTTSWPHYFCYLPFCQASLFSKLGNPIKGDLPRIILWSLVFLSVAASSTFVFNWFTRWNDYSYYGLLFISNMLLLIPLYSITFNNWERLDEPCGSN